MVATYANINSLFYEHEGFEQYQYELCEKPVVTLPSSFGQADLVYGWSIHVRGSARYQWKYVLGNVVHAIHTVNIGLEPIVPTIFEPLLNHGIIKNPSITNFDAFIETGAPFIPMLREAKHIGSMYTIRTVLPRLERTDARPTLVSSLDDTYIQIFSGKIGNCVLAAQEAVALMSSS